MWIPTSSSRAGGNAYGTGALIFCSYILGVGVIVFVMTTNEKFALLLNHFASTVKKLLPQLGLSGVILLSGLTLLAITRVHGKMTEEHNAEVLYKCRRLCSLIIYAVIGACCLLLAQAYIMEEGVNWVTRAVMAGVNFFGIYIWLHYMHSRVVVLERAMVTAHGGRGRHERLRIGTTATVTVDNQQMSVPVQVPADSIDSYSYPNLPNECLTAAPPPYSEVMRLGDDAIANVEFCDPAAVHNRSITPPPCYKETELAKKINDALS